MVDIPGQGLWYPQMPTLTLTPSLANALVIDATGEKIAFCGRVWHTAGTGAKNIVRVGLMFGAVTKAGGSGLVVSLQDVDLANGSPIQPDETQDQTVAVANGDATFASNTWHRTGAFNAARSVQHGEYLAVVIEFDGSGRQGADSVIVQGLTKSSSGLLPANHNCASALKTSGTWADQLVIPNVILEFDDGSFGTLDGSQIAAGFNSTSFNSSSSPDEIALAFKVPFHCEIDGIWMVFNPQANNRDAEIVLYEGTTILNTFTLDTNAIPSTSTRTLFVPIPKQALKPNTQYYLSYRPLTTSNATIYSYDVADVNHLNVISGGPDCNYATRTNQGAWDAITTTRRIWAGVRISKIFTPLSKVHGGLVH